MTMFEKELTNAGHTTRFTITEAGPEGWDVRVEEDRKTAVAERPRTIVMQDPEGNEFCLH